jgi:hypothetical protein
VNAVQSSKEFDNYLLEEEYGHSGCPCRG